MDQSFLFVVNWNHWHSDRTFSNPKIVGIWHSVRLDTWLPISVSVRIKDKTLPITPTSDDKNLTEIKVYMG